MKKELQQMTQQPTEVVLDDDMVISSPCEQEVEQVLENVVKPEITHETELQVNYAKILKNKHFSLFCIRCFDIAASFLGLLVLAVPFLLVAFAIKLSSKGPVFFKQLRVGKGEKEFRIIKFRTMTDHAETKGMQITVGKDMRVTKIGKILRKFKIDELPQLFNVLFGQMSLVGYRPEVPKYVAMYTENQRSVFLIRPGITDLASIEYRDESEVLAKASDPEGTYINEVMQKKLALNLKYMENIGFWNNIKIIFKTVLAILK